MHQDDFTSNMLERIRTQKLFDPPLIDSPIDSPNRINPIDFTQFPRGRRKESLFSVPDISEENNPSSNVPNFNTPNFNISDYTPETEARDRFNRVLGEIPDRPNPGMLRRIIAGVAGAFDENLGEDIAYGDYTRKVADWKLKAEPALKAAELERASNINERSYAIQQARNDIAVFNASTREYFSQLKYELDKEKSDRIYETKINELNETIRNHNMIKEKADAELIAKVNNQEAINASKEAAQNLREAIFERSKITQERDFLEKQRQFNMDMEATISKLAQWEKDFLQRSGGGSQVTTEVNPERTKRTTTTRRFGPGPVGTNVMPQDQVLMVAPFPNPRTGKPQEGYVNKSEVDRLLKLGYKIVQ